MKHIRQGAKKTLVLFMMIVLALSAFGFKRSDASTIYNESDSRDLTNTCGYDRIINSGRFMLGNTHNTILNGGKKLKIGDTIYIADDSGLYCQDTVEETVYRCMNCAVSNLNFCEDKIYYTSLSDEKTIFGVYNTVNGSNTILFEELSPVKQMYLISGNHIVYLRSDGVFAYDIALNQHYNIYHKEGLIGFIPTEYGVIYIGGTVGSYELFTGKHLIARGITHYLFDDGILLLYNKEGGTQINSQSIFQISEGVTDNIDPLFTDEMEREPISIYVNDNVHDPFDDLIEDDDCEDCNQIVIENTNGSQVPNRPLTEYIETPMESWQQDILKRARQIKEIKWTCLKKITGWNNVQYTAGTVYRGIPYGQPSQQGRYVPWSASFATFLQQSQNINSNFYTKKSENTSGEKSTYYAADCSSFVSYAWALPTRRTTRSLDDNDITDRITAPSNEDIIYSLQVGDCLDKAGSHAILVASVKRDSNGSVAEIVTWEQRTLTANSIRNIQVFRGTVNYTPSYHSYNQYQNAFGSNGEMMPLEALQLRIDEGYGVYRLNSATQADVSYSHDCASPIDGDFCDNCIPPLSAVTNLSIDYSALNTVTVNWQAVSGADGYEIERSVNGGEYQFVGNATTNAYVESEFNGSPISIRIRAYKTIDGICDYSRKSAVTIDPNGHIPFVSATVDANIPSVTLTWTRPTGLTGTVRYCVFRSTSPNSGFVLLNSQGSPAYSTTSTSYVDIAVASNTKYYYRVCAVNSTTGNYSPASAILAYSGGGQYGDVNDDGMITAADAASILRCVVGLETYTPQQIAVADVNLDGYVTAADASAILRYVVGLCVLPPVINNINNRGTIEYTRSLGQGMYVVKTVSSDEKVQFEIRFAADQAEKVLALQFNLIWDSSVMEYHSNSSPLETISNVTDGSFSFVYADAYGVSLDKNDLILTISFAVIPGASSQPSIELMINDVEIAIVNKDGMISIVGTACEE